MARVKNTWWNRNKFKMSGLVIVLSAVFFYQSLNPKFPELWSAKVIGEYNVSPMPFNLKQPYLHHGVYTKDFFLIFNKGQVKNIRQAYLNIGTKALPLASLEQGEDGILHGSQHGQEVHAISPKVLSEKDKLWLTIENWNGEVLVTYWDIPVQFLD
ncbi:hypothetical protein ACFSJY_06475 [Thalassotalea euphylliae]|uniref:hypothetical protein n=1 Tax=Thalassotalea euphylliae TaxID=1655234 RepID=UPI00362FE3E4